MNDDDLALEQQPKPVRQLLRIKRVAGELNVSLRHLASEAGISVSGLHGVMHNFWPVRMRRDELERRLTSALQAAGASKAQLEGLFEPYDPNQNRRRWALPRAAAEKAPLSPEVDMLLPKQTLSRDAAKAFRLFSNPFDGEVVEDSQMFASGEIAYVREACLQAATSGRFVAVVGESGAGKTTIQSDLESRIQREKKPIIVIKPWVLGMEDSDAKGKTLKSADILASIVTTLSPLARMPQTLQARSNLASRLLTESAQSGFSHLLVVEEAHAMPEATLKHLKRLNEMKLGRKPLLGIVLLGQTELALKLDPRRANLREVTQRCEVVQLLPLDGDLQAYLEHRASLAGRPLSDFIDTGGIEELRARLTVARPGTGGKTRVMSLLYPLAVNNLLTAALNCAADLHEPLVTRDVVRAV